MRFRLATSGAGGGGQELAGGVGNLFRSMAMAPALAAQASLEAQDAQAQRELRGAQMRAADAAALFNQTKAREIDEGLQRGTPGALLRNAAMIHRVAPEQQPDLVSYLETGQMAGQYTPAPDGMGPVLPTPALYTDGTAQQVMRTAGLSNQALAQGDKNVENLFKALGLQRGMDLGDDVLAGRRSAADVGQAQAAMEGKKLVDAIGNTGMGYNLFTGQGQQVDPGLRAIFGDESAAQVKLRNAQTDAAYASAENSRASRDKTRQTIAAGPPGAGKPLPSTALKLQHEGLEAIGLASSISADLDAVEQQLYDGTLDLGPVANLISRGQNAAGLSTESSRNFGSFMSTLEKMRNDSLRLNSGVQTEGDAQRAWNELLANINDPQLVRQRIGEIKRINQRAAELKRLQVDMIRANFGKEPLDTSGFTNVAPALGTGSAPAVADPLGIRKR